MRELVLVHGRAQEHRDAVGLKRLWLEALARGLRKSRLDLPIPEERVRFPYYGDTLHDLVGGVSPDAVADVVVKGSGAPDALEQAFVLATLNEVLEREGISDDQVMTEALAARATRGGAGTAGGPDVVEQGPLNWAWVRGILSAIDRYVPGASGASIALFTRDVYLYLSHPGIRDVIETGVRQAIPRDAECVVVGHSLGSVVTYSLLRREGTVLGWRVPLFVTVGAPLAITKIKRALAPNQHPACAEKWFNAMDPDDVVALYPLDGHHFPVDPGIENKTNVDNPTPNQHGIEGYLSDPEVARRIHDALVGGN